MNCNTGLGAIEYVVPLATPSGSAADRSLSVIIPAYNESENIIATLENITTALEPLALPHEILVIDDGSRDDTAALVEASTARFPFVAQQAHGTWASAGRTGAAWKPLPSRTS